MAAEKRLGKTVIKLGCPPSVCASACVAGKNEARGPLKDSFDLINTDSTFGQKTWEQAESFMQQTALRLALEKADLSAQALDCVFAGDLVNQCVASAFAVRDGGFPFVGLYGACSTMAEGLCLGAMLIDGGFANRVAAVTSSHFCTAERQYRTPLEYGSQRTPTAQWTATAAGCAILGAVDTPPYVTHTVLGHVVDGGIKDANNMGAAMAPAAYDTLKAVFDETGTGPRDFDLILTGDLAQLGSQILRELFEKDGIELGDIYQDCGLLLYDRKKQDMHMGGSGCGCSASVLCGHILNGMRAGRWNRVLFAGTGALMSPLTCQQGQSIPGICHGVILSMTKS